MASVVLMRYTTRSKQEIMGTVIGHLGALNVPLDTTREPKGTTMGRNVYRLVSQAYISVLSAH